ncbi:MAG TPA: FtsX-like permease family protein, partial [Candidatus Dormibacteraeota bacterium]|nr:FtsX-like permease family protein [Candidatus Dormibacteraeota bacterium]
TPRGVARRSTPPPPTRLRIVPLVASLIALALSLSVGPTLLRAIVIEVVAVSFLGVILGIVIAGPWFTAAVGRALASSGGAVRLLAGRRLLDDPRASFLSVAGVVMAVFVATTFFGFQSSVTHAIQAVSLPTLDTTVYAEVRPGDAQAAGASAGTLASVPGVRAVALVRVATLVGAHASRQMVWIAPCRDLVATLRLPHVDCGPGLIHLVGKGTVPASARLMPATTTAPAGDAAPESGVAVPSGVAVDRLLVGPWPGDARTNPVAIVEPAVAGADLTAFATERVLVGTDGDPVTIERARTIIETAAPTSGPATTAELLRTVTRTFSELGWVISLGVLMTMLVAGFGLAVALVGGLLDRRRPFALLRLTGVPVDRLQRVVLLEAAAPLAVVAAVSGVLGVLVSQLVLRLVGVPQVALPDASLVVLLVASVGGAIALSVAALPLVEPVTSLQETRFE